MHPPPGAFPRMLSDGPAVFHTGSIQPPVCRCTPNRTGDTVDVNTRSAPESCWRSAGRRMFSWHPPRGSRGPVPTAASGCFRRRSPIQWAAFSLPASGSGLPASEPHDASGPQAIMRYATRISLRVPVPIFPLDVPIAFLCSCRSIRSQSTIRLGRPEIRQAARHSLQARPNGLAP
jgi:hypothetical protein